VAYVSLYRKYRPQTFSEIVGQDHVSNTLAQAITDDRLHHAYLFTGPRGTGKTSTARILAKAVNCIHGPTAKPCNECVQCVAVTNGSSVDVIEIDAASHGGVDDVRDLRDRVAFAPASARMKIYIVDECHMLSTAGWNAFLKTVEEPPGHVLFAFATTEPHKVPATILSRTQRFDLKRVPAELLAGHVRDLCARERVTIDADAVEMVVRAGDGSVRDTLSVLDQVMASGSGTITALAVADMLGVTPADLLAQAADALASHDAAAVMSLVQRVANAGQDPRQFARDLVEHLRALFLLQIAPDAGLVETTPERLAELTAQSTRLGRHELVRAMDLLTEAQAMMRRSSTRLPLELALAKAAMPEHSGDARALAARLDRLERPGSFVSAERVQIDRHSGQNAPTEGEKLGTTPEPHPEPAPQADPEPAPQVDPEPAPQAVPDEAKLIDLPAQPVATSDDEEPQLLAPVVTGDAGLDEIVRSWDRIMDRVKARKIRFHAMLQMGRPFALDGNVLTLEFRDGYSLHADHCGSGLGAETIAGAVEDVLGFAPVIRTVMGAGDGHASLMARPADDTQHDEAVEVMETEAAERHGELPDDGQAEAMALETLTSTLGATVMDDS